MARQSIYARPIQPIQPTQLIQRFLNTRFLSQLAAYKWGAMSSRPWLRVYGSIEVSGEEMEDWNYRRVTTSHVMSLNQFIQLFQGTAARAVHVDCP